MGIINKASYFLHQSTGIAELCDPLFKTSGIIGFLFMRFFSDGSIIMLTDNAQYLDWHLSKEYLITPIGPSKITTDNLTLMSTPEVVPNYNQVLQGMRDIFGYDYPITLVEKKEESIDAYCFTSQLTGHSNVNLYLNSIGTLEKFKSHFKVKTNKFLEKAKSERIFLPSHMWPDDSHININDIVPTCTPLADLKLPYHNTQGVEIYLSKQQETVVNYLQQGLTIKEIGSVMSLSNRTIEHYLEHIKQKFGCYKKSELLKYLKRCE